MAKRNTETLNDLSRCLDPLDMDATLIAVIEMSQSSWLVAGIVPGVERQPLKKIAIDEHALLKLLSRWRKVTRSDALPSRSRPDTTVSAWRAGSLHSASRPRHSCIKCRGHARTPPSEDRSARHGASEAWLSRLAARRARALQDGRSTDACRGGRQAAEPGARDARG